MQTNPVINAKNLKTVVIITVILVIFSLIMSFMQIPKYESTSKLIVVFNQENIDVYTAAQTSNYIAGILSEVVYSHSFIDAVLASNFDLQDTLGFSQEKRLKNWQKMVKVRIQDNKGIMIIDVLNTDKNQAHQYAQAISYVLITKHAQYHGSGDKVSLKIIDTPVISDKWAQPNIPQNILLGALAGLLIGISLIVVFPEQRLNQAILDQIKRAKPQTKKDRQIDLTKVAANQNQVAQPESDPQAAGQDNQEHYYNW